MFVATRDIETRKFKLAAGQALPPSYQGKYARDSMEKVYGKGLFLEVTHRNVNEFKNFIAKIAGSTDKQKVEQLSALCDEQAKKIQSLEEEVLKLKSSKKALAEKAAQQS